MSAARRILGGMFLAVALSPATEAQVLSTLDFDVSVVRANIVHSAVNHFPFGGNSPSSDGRLFAYGTEETNGGQDRRGIIKVIMTVTEGSSVRGYLGFTLRIRPVIRTAVVVNSRRANLNFAFGGFREYGADGVSGNNLGGQIIHPEDITIETVDGRPVPLLNVSAPTGTRSGYSQNVAFAASGDTGAEVRFFIAIGENPQSGAPETFLVAGDRIIFHVPGIMQITPPRARGSQIATPSLAHHASIEMVITSGSGAPGVGNPFTQLDGRTFEGNNVLTIFRTIVLDNQLGGSAAGSLATVDSSDISRLDTNFVNVLIPSIPATLQAAHLGDFGFITQSGGLIITLRDGVTPSSSVSSGDTLQLRVAGPFWPGRAAMFLDVNSNRVMDAGEAFAINEDTDGDQILTIPSASFTRLETMRSLYLVRWNRGDNWRPGSRWTSRLRAERPGRSTIEGTVITTALNAADITEAETLLHVANCNSSNPVHAYVINESEEDVWVFASGYEGDGDYMGYELVDARLRGRGRAYFGPRESLILETRHLEEMFGYVTTSRLEAPEDGGEVYACSDETTWTGRAHLTFFATGPISVKPLSRTMEGARVPWVDVR